MSTTATPADLAPTRTAAPPQAVPQGWLLGRALDLAFISNLAWPLVALFVALYSESSAHQAFGFLLAYFVILPHRWITLALVFLDPNKFATRSKAFLLVLAFVVFSCLTVKLTLPGLAVLVAVDYLWNAWHFAAQHSGVLSIYNRAARPDGAGADRFEKYGLRVFLIFTLLRLTGQFVPAGSVPWLDWVEASTPNLAWLDFCVLAIPAALILRELATFRATAWGRLAYLSSVSAPYGGLLMGIRYELPALSLGCAVATTLFHSTEYLAIVTWYVGKNRSLSQSRLWATLVPRWAMSLVAFMAFFAISAYFLAERHLEAWLWVNINVSLLHYAYDGMIWKRQKKT